MSQRKVFLGLGAAAIATGAALWFPRQCPSTKSQSPISYLNNSQYPVTLVDKKVPVPVKLLERKVINHDTELFRFGLPSQDHILGLPTGQHVHLQTEVNGKKLVRVYTPVSSDDNKGVMDLVIKLYRPNVHPAFPDGGKMSGVLDHMAPGDSIDARGPTGRFFYKGRGRLAFKKEKKDPEPTIFHDVKKVIMIAGGSGITPMLQFIKHVLKDAEDRTQLELLFANKSEQDIMLRDELEALASSNPGRLKLWYTIDSAPQGWKYSTGHINADMIHQHLSSPTSDTFVFLCGPKPMIKNACLPALKQLGFDSNLIHKF